MRFMIDPGHGGENRGASVHPDNAITEEADLNLEIVEVIKQNMPILLSTDNFITYTRDKDITVPNKDRGLQAKEQNIDYIFSIHCNAFPYPRSHGSLIFANPNNNKTMNIGDVIARSMPNPLWRHSQSRVQPARENVFPRVCALLRDLEAPTVLIECGFLTNKKDLEALKNKRIQEGIALAVYCGMLYALLLNERNGQL